MDPAAHATEHAALLAPRTRTSSTASVEKNVSKDRETRTLIYACLLTTFFFIVELVGGYIAGSLAIMSDAAHLLSDLAGFLISLMAITVARLPANATMSFGFARAEVLGAFVSILFIWALTIVLVLFAVYRLFHPEPVNGPLMLILGGIGLVVNLILGLVLGHGHSHAGHDHSHAAHSHSHEHAHNHHHDADASAAARDVEAAIVICDSPPDYQSTDNHHHSAHDHGHSHGTEGSAFNWRSLLFGNDIESVNLRAAYLHVLGDALQNIGVIVAALIIAINPRLSFIDPICTLFFAVIVVMTTRGLAQETLDVLMEGTPSSIKLDHIYSSLKSIGGVSRVGDLHVWSITARQPALSVHLYKKAEAAGHEVLKTAQKVLSSRFGILHATVQVNCEEMACCDEEQNIGDGSQQNNCMSYDNIPAPAS